MLSVLPASDGHSKGVTGVCILRKCTLASCGLRLTENEVRFSKFSFNNNSVRLQEAVTPLQSGWTGETAVRLPRTLGPP